jgi:hypothetical protein
LRDDQRERRYRTAESDANVPLNRDVPRRHSARRDWLGFEIFGERQGKHIDALTRRQLLEQQCSTIREPNRIAMGVLVGADLRKGNVFDWSYLNFALQIRRYVPQAEPRSRGHTDDAGRAIVGFLQPLHCPPPPTTGGRSLQLDRLRHFSDET